MCKTLVQSHQQPITVPHPMQKQYPMGIGLPYMMGSKHLYSSGNCFNVCCFLLMVHHAYIPTEIINKRCCGRNMLRHGDWTSQLEAGIIKCLSARWLADLLWTCMPQCLHRIQHAQGLHFLSSMIPIGNGNGNDWQFFNKQSGVSGIGCVKKNTLFWQSLVSGMIIMSKGIYYFQWIYEVLYTCS